MNGIERITQRINDDVMKEIAELEKSTEAELVEIEAKYDALVARASHDATIQSSHQAAERIERMGSVARLEGRKQLLATKQDLINEAFDLALNQLVNMPEGDYVELLAKLAATASRTGQEKVILSQKDRTRHGKTVVMRANEMLTQDVKPKLPQELTGNPAGDLLDKVVTSATAYLTGARLTLAEETRPMAGGLILAGDRVETNCSFETLVRLQREKISAQVATELFGENK